MFTIVRASQYLLAEELLEHLAEKLQVEPQMLWGNPHSVRNLVRRRYRVANFKRQTQLPCFLCKGPFVSDGPCRAEVKQLPCCMGDVHHECYNNACQQYYFNCPHCNCPLNASGVDHELMGAMDYVYMRKARQHVQVMRTNPPCGCTRPKWRNRDTDQPWHNCPPPLDNSKQLWSSPAQVRCSLVDSHG